MIRSGKSIRLTSREQKALMPMNHGMPIKAHTVEDFNRFIDAKIADLCPGDTPDEKFVRGMLEHFKVKD